MPPTPMTKVQLWPRGRMWAEFQPISTRLRGFFSGYSGFPPSSKSTPMQSITSSWVCGAPRSHMDRMAAAVGAFTCIRSDPVEPVYPVGIL